MMQQAMPPANLLQLAQHAKAFASNHGGQVHRYADIKPEMVDLTGGALHDTRM